MTEDTPLWRPSAASIQDSHLLAFWRQACSAFDAPAPLEGADPGYGRLWQWSIAERAKFWDAVMQFSGTIADRGPGPVVVGVAQLLNYNAHRHPALTSAFCWRPS